MADDFVELNDGDELEPYHINMLIRDCNRWRKLVAVPPLSLSGLDGDQLILRLDETPTFFIQLTGTYSSGYPWKEVYITPGRVLVDSGMIGSAADRPAFELQTGDTTLLAGSTVYEARISPASNQVLFDGKN